MATVFTVAASLFFAGLGGWTASQPPVMISGTITDTTGRGLPGARITVIAEDGERRTTITDSTGQYRSAELTPGLYTVEASMAGFDARSADVTVPAGGGAAWSGALLVAPPPGETSIERRVANFTGSGALDCGRYAAPASEAALQRSLACALASAQAHRSFSVIVQFTAGRTDGGEGLLGAPDGMIQLLQYGKGAMGFRMQPCASPQVRQSHFTCER